MTSVEQDPVNSGTEMVTVELSIDADVFVEIDQRGRQTLVQTDGKTEVRMAVPPMTDGDEYPYMHAWKLARRIEEQATEIRRNSLAWHGPVNGPGGWT